MEPGVFGFPQALLSEVPDRLSYILVSLSMYYLHSQ